MATAFEAPSILIPKGVGCNIRQLLACSTLRYQKQTLFYWNFGPYLCHSLC